MSKKINRTRAEFEKLARATTSTWSLAADDDSRSAYLHIYGVIGDYWDGIAAQDIVPAIRAIDADTVTIYLNSPGGDVYDGLAIYSAIAAHPARVTVVVDALAASIASVIACAADEIMMSPAAEIMIHDAWGFSVGSADDFRKAADDLDRISDKIAGIYAVRAGSDAEEFRDLMRAETWYNADHAVTAGLADSVDTHDTADLTAAAGLTAQIFDLTALYPHRAAALATRGPRKEINTMPSTLTRDTLDSVLAEHTAEITRTLDVRLNALTTGSRPAGPSWPTAGHFLKDLATGQAAALDFYTERVKNAFDGSTTADTNTPNTWIGDAIHLVNRLRTVMGSFTTEPLPESGMTMEYLKLKSNTITVADQGGEGKDLQKGKITLDSDTVPISTYGGWTELSMQTAKRATPAYLDTTEKAMNIEYARATEQAVRDLFAEVLAARTETARLTLSAKADTNAWLDLLVDAYMLFEQDLGYSLDASYVSADVFKQLLHLEDRAGNRVMTVRGQSVNQIGEVSIPALSGELVSVAFRILPGAKPGTVEFHDRIGLTIWEEPGAPFRLQDQNIVNLSQSFSKFGALAAASQYPDAIQPVKIGA